VQKIWYLIATNNYLYKLIEDEENSKIYELENLELKFKDQVISDINLSQWGLLITTSTGTYLFSMEGKYVEKFLRWEIKETNGWDHFVVEHENSLGVYD